MNSKTQSSKIAGLSALGLLLCLFSTIAAAQNPAHDLQDLVGVRGGSGEQALQDRGYAFVKSEQGVDRMFSNWWNRSTHTCVTVATMNGVYAAITTSPPFDCGRDEADSGGGSDRREWVAGLIGARGSALDSEMQGHGFENVDSLQEDVRATTWWFNRKSGACLRAVVEDGRVAGITPTPHYPACQ